MPAQLRQGNFLHCIKSLLPDLGQGHANFAGWYVGAIGTWLIEIGGSAAEQRYRPLEDAVDSGEVDFTRFFHQMVATSSALHTGDHLVALQFNEDGFQEFLRDLGVFGNVLCLYKSLIFSEIDEGLDGIFCFLC